MRQISRRELGKGAAAAVVTAALPGRGEAAVAVTTAAAAAETERKRRTVSGAWEQVHPGVWRATIGTPEPFTPVRSRLVDARADSLRDLPSVPECPLEPVQGEIGERGTVVRLPLQPHENIYGFGLQLFSTEQRGKKRALRVNADPVADTGDTHAPVPFYVSTRGYGVLVDTARYATVYAGNAHPRPSRPVTGASNGLTPNYTGGVRPEDLAELLVEIPAAGGADVYLFAGPAMLDAVRRYNLFSGGGCMPPEWGLGFWYRASSSAVQSYIEGLVDEFRERKIPCDVIGIEPGWQTHAYSCTFAWNNQRFPDPAGFVKRLGKQDIRVNLWEHAFTHPDSPLFAPLQPHSGDYGVWGGLVPDFAGAEARRIFGDYHDRTFLAIGVSGFKLDECDNSDFTGGWSFPELSHFPSGVDGEQMHAVFGLRYQQAIWEPFQKRGEPTYGLVRSSGALAAPYPFVLYSDLYNHRQFIRALVNSGFSGLLWCPEVRDAKSQEDLIRRLQSVVFSPLAMVNGWYIENPPWKQLDRDRNNAGQLQEGWQTLEATCREIIGWRMQLIPYLRAAFGRYAADGTPPFRALPLDWPDDPALEKVDDAYLIGDRMLVAPLFAGEPERTVVLPAGQWHDFWTGKPVAGGTHFSVPASTEKIPVYVKAGSVLPLAAVTNSTADPESRELTVCVYGDGSLPFSMTLPSGETLDLHWNTKTAAGTVTQHGAERPYRVTAWKQMG